MNVKKILPILLAATMLTACGKSNTATPVAKAPTESHETVENNSKEASTEANVKPLEAEPESVKVHKPVEERPAAFKNAEELVFGETYTIDSAKKYTFEVDKSGKFEFLFDNGPDAEIYDQEGKQLSEEYVNAIGFLNSRSNISKGEYEATNIHRLKAGRYYLKLNKHSTDGRYFDPRKNENDSVTVTYKSSDEYFVEDYSINDNSFESANNILLNKTYKGQIGMNDSFDVFKFTVPVDDKITIVYKSSLNKASYNLYDSERNWVPENIGKNEKALAKKLGNTDLEKEIYESLFSEVRCLPDNSDTVTQSIDLKQGTYYLFIQGSLGGGMGLQYHTGEYEFTVYDSANK